MTSPTPLSHPRRRPASRPFLSLVSAAAAVALLLAGCGGTEAGPSADPPDGGDPVVVRLARVEPTPVSRRFESTGTVLPLTSVSPGTKILGRVDEVAVREGDRVERGDLLARLENRDLQAAVREAEAGVAMARARLENARTQHARIQSLHARGSATEKSLEDAVAGLAVAEAGLQQAEAGLESARVMFSYAEVRSPLAGFVVSKRIEPGDMATPGTPLFTVEDLSEVEVQVEVPESEIGDLEIGQPATLSLLGVSRRAEIDRILSGNAGSRTFDVRFVVSNEEGLARPGMFVRAAFAGREEDVLLVPESALVRRGGLTGLYVAEDSPQGLRARLHWVEVGRRIEEDGREVRHEILAGLEIGDRLIVEPPAGLVDGARLEVAS